jgi:hypothetical protein
MPISRSPIEIAQELLGALSEDHLSVLGVLAEASRRQSNPNGAKGWSHLAHHLHKCLQEEGSWGQVSWRSIQIVEQCRHRAAQAEREAAKLSDPKRRQEAIAVATQWSELATIAELIGAGAQASAA